MSNTRRTLSIGSRQHPAQFPIRNFAAATQQPLAAGVAVTISLAAGHYEIRSDVAVAYRHGEGIVERVLRVSDDLEHRGEEYLRDDLGLRGRWLQMSFSGSIRGRFAGIGMIYHEDLDMFIDPRSSPDWTLGENGDWQPPAEPGDDYSATD